MTIIVCAVSVMGICGIITGLLVGLAGKVFFTEEDEKVTLIRKELPGNNCGGCGYAGCDEFARAVAEGKAEFVMCVVPINKEKAYTVSKILGYAIEEKDRRIMHVRCIGTCSKAPDKYIYTGVPDCISALIIPEGGKKACSYGCLGLGTCVKVCRYGAISIKDGVAHIDKGRCTGCGKCKEACPRNLIESIPYDAGYKVGCNNNDKGKDVKNVCSAGCIGCGLCKKSCKAGAIELVHNIPHIDYSKCVKCGKCKESCVTGCISGFVDNT